MKKIKLFLLLAVSIMVLSCGNDDDSQMDDQNTNAALLIGTWKIITLTVNGVNTPLDDCEIMETLMFDGTNLVDSYFYDNGSTECATEIINSTYIVEGNSITDTTENVTVEILTLNNTQLSFKEIATEDMEEVIYISTFSRQ